MATSIQLVYTQLVFVLNYCLFLLLLIESMDSLSNFSLYIIYAAYILFPSRFKHFTLPASFIMCDFIAFEFLKLEEM